jgi:hypothetical protein
MRALTIPLIFCLCLACGCGSLIRGNTQEIHIASYPPGASGEVDGMSIQTPAKLMLTRNEPHTVVLRKEGYTAHRTEINKEFSWSPFITDLVFWKVLRSKGLSAGAWRLTPEEIYANLEIEEASMEHLLQRARILLIQADDEEAAAGTPEAPPFFFRPCFAWPKRPRSSPPRISLTRASEPSIRAPPSSCSRQKGTGIARAAPSSPMDGSSNRL